MRRFSSLKNAPGETRKILRDRFARHLTFHNIAFNPSPTDVTLPDELLLQLLLNLTIDFESDLGNVRAAYNAALCPNSIMPSLDELIAEGWLHVVWGRISTTFEIAEAARVDPSGKLTPLVTLLDRRHGQVYRLPTALKADKSFAHVATAIEKGNLALHEIGCQTPAWVAARLWERILKRSSDSSTALRTWVDRYQHLGSPSLIPARIWNDMTAVVFHEAAFGVLESDRNLADWEAMRLDVLKQMSLLSQEPPSSVWRHVTPVPKTLVDRALWLTDYSMAHIFSGRMSDYFEDFLVLTQLLLADVEAEDDAQAPHKVAERLFTLATERPGLFFIVLFLASRNSLLLADLLLFPKTSVLACLLVAQWQSPSSAWDRELIDRDNEFARTTAFADAVSVMGYLLEQGMVDPSEAAALMNWFHRQAQIGFVDDLENSESMLGILRGELARQSPDVLQTMVNALLTLGGQLGLGTSNFAAVLDIVDAGQLAESIDATVLVETYIRSVAAGEHTLAARRVNTGAAASLYRLALGAPAELRHEFLYPVDVKERLAAGAEENPFSRTGDISASVREHIRVLSRVVVGWTETIPDELVNALVTAVRTGALKHQEKGRVAAFSAVYEANALHQPYDRPIAADIGAAIKVLDEERGEKLLAAVLETDEPMMLAQLLSFAPYTTREPIKNRIAQITPTEAGDTNSLAEVQARIEALLSAGLPDAAAMFIEDERNIETWGPVPGREVTRLGATLRLKLMREAWGEIADTEPPSYLSHTERKAAIETISFYKALAELKNPDGNRQAAQHTLAKLQSSHPEVATYALNLFAARINNLLDDGVFGQLQDGALVRGRQILVETQEIMLRVTAFSDSEAEIFQCNQALLLLALGQPEQANELLASLHTTRLHDTVAAYHAVALARLGWQAEAVAVLKRASDVLGETDVLRVARAHIQLGSPFTADPHLSLDEDLVTSTRAAILNLKQMDPIQQAKVFMPAKEPFDEDEFVINQVRSTTASVISLVPMMRKVVIDSCEDDLTALVRELLIVRVHYLDWSVSDQSKGGFTSKGNPGERDLILKRGNTTLAVIEAVVCKQGWSRQNLKIHLERLLAYSTCKLFFHITYSYVTDPYTIMDALRQLASQDVSESFKFLEWKDIPHTDTRPPGFGAHYTGQFGPVKVVFLVLDLGQHAQREAVTKQ